MSELPVKQSRIEFYAQIVRDRARRRSMQEAARALMLACNNGHEPHELADEAAVLWRMGNDLVAPANQLCPTTSSALEELSQSLATPGRKVRTFLPSIDCFNGGVLPGEVMVVIARPRVGKSALASQIALNAARSGDPVCFFSLEMPRAQALLRLTQAANGWIEREAEKYAAERWSGVTEQQKGQVAIIRDEISIIETGIRGVDQLQMGLELSERAMQKRPRLAILDYLGLMGGSSRRASLYERISNAATEMKRFAKEAKVAVIALCQATRNENPLASEGAARLGLDAARDSGQIEEAGDFLVTLWRPELSPKLTELDRREVAGKLCGSMVKNRRGPEGDFTLWFDKPTQGITDPGGVG